MYILLLLLFQVETTEDKKYKTSSTELTEYYTLISTKSILMILSYLIPASTYIR